MPHLSVCITHLTYTLLIQQDITTLYTIDLFHLHNGTHYVNLTTSHHFEIKSKKENNSLKNVPHHINSLALFVGY